MATWRSPDQTCWNRRYHTVRSRALGAEWCFGLKEWWNLIRCCVGAWPSAVCVFSIVLPFSCSFFASVNLSFSLSFQAFVSLSVYLSLSGVVNKICWTAEFSKGLCLENTRSCVASVGSPPALLQIVCCVYLSQMQPFLHWRLCHAVHTLTLLPPTEMPHQGEAFSRAYINSCLLVAWEILQYIHLWGLFSERYTKLILWPCHCFSKMLKWLF